MKRNRTAKVGITVTRTFLFLTFTLSIQAAALESSQTNKGQRKAQQDDAFLEIPTNWWPVPLDPTPKPTSAPSTSRTPTSNPTESSSPSFSKTPSSAPSVGPSVSPRPSNPPTGEPSETPSASFIPSDEPSTTPTVSITPTISPQPSSYPTLAPSLSPSMPPSDSPIPSSIPSEIPSSAPTRSPSSAPSLLPSDKPTDFPSLFPSNFPTKNPSVSPTPLPSNNPSASPSKNPTTFPSAMPSAFPTFECHDDAAYRSPINGLTCDDHQGTSCVGWREVGLNTTELGDLLEHCPETCGIPCGSFTQFSISVSFHLSNIPGFLDSNAKKILEATLTDFITEWVHATESDFTFVLDSVELTSQNLVTTQRHVRRLTGSTLEVSVLFDGFTIGLTGDEVSELIVSGIDSSAFETALQQSNDFFSVAKVSSTSEVDNEVGAEIEGEEKTGASTATVVVAVLVSVSVFTFVLGACVYHGTSGQWVPQMKLPRLSNANLENNSSPRLSIPGSPPAASLLSFDESRAGEAPNGFVRLMLSLSRSNSRSTDPDDSESHPSSDDPCLAPIISPMSEQSEESAPAEHPLANIIPPMIVIENIDDDAEICAENSTRKNQQVPSKRGEASSDFRTSLRDYRNHPEQPNTVAGMLYNGSSFVSDLNLSAWSTAEAPEDQERVLSPLGIIVDSDSDDDTSVASTPVHSKTPKAPLPLRKSISSSALESFDRNRPPLHIPDQLQVTMSLPDQDDERWSFASKSDDEHDSIGLELEAVSLTPQTPALRPHPPSISTEWQLPSPADKTGMVSGSPSDGGRFIQSIWSLSPIAKTIKNTWESTPRASKRKASMPKMSDYKRKASSETLENIEGGIDAGNSALFNTINTTNDNFRRLEFEAPRKGQLGLVIEAKDNMGPIVHGVKDYSPLFGLVQAGDQIVEVDGRKTSQSTLSEITKLLAVRPGRRSSNLRIVVSRSMKPSSSQLLHSVNHTRDNSYGSSSIASSKILEDIDAGSEVSVDDVLKYSKQGNLR